MGFLKFPLMEPLIWAVIAAEVELIDCVFFGNNVLY
jgi:hypothetical protein